MKFGTLAEYRREISRVESAMEKTSSEHLQRDYGKYLKRLQGEARRLMREVRCSV